MASRRIEDLHPDLQPLARRFLERCAERQVDVLIVCTYRSNEEQDALYAIGRTPGDKRARVTNARAGQSKHNATMRTGDFVDVPAALAFDAVPLLHGKAIWEDPRDKDTDWTNDFGWRVMGEVAEELGLVWYGRPDAPFREAPHFQLP